jgi:hypothetical protein
VEWFSKRQGSVETATYGSEFVAARQATEQIMDLRYTLRAMGMPLDGPSWMYGDNQSVITSSTIPHSLLSKRHNALSYHRVREAIAKRIFYFCKLDGKQNPADCLTKPAGHQVFWPITKVLLFWRGETKLGHGGEETTEFSSRGVANPDSDSRNSVRDNVREGVREDVRDSVREGVRDSVRDSMSHATPRGS